MLVNCLRRRGIVVIAAYSLLFFIPTSVFADIRLTTWNMKHLGRTAQDLDKVADVLKESDMVLLQEVNSSKSGAAALSDLNRRIRDKSGARFCIGLSEIPTDAKERYGMLWREDKLAYVTTSGKPLDSCPEFAVTLRLGAKSADKIMREPAVGLFLEKSTKRKFWAITIHTVPTAKHPAAEVPYVFDTAQDIAGKLPAIVAGDFNLSCADPSFKMALLSGFKPALPCEVKTSFKRSAKAMSAAYDNILVRGLPTGGATVVNLYARFPELSAKEVFNDLSDHAPVSALIETGDVPAAAAVH